MFHMAAVFAYETVASEFLRALRGARSQTAFARRLGYRSNVVHSWEVGRAFPTASKALWAAERVGMDVSAAVLTLYRKRPGWLSDSDVTTPAGVAQFLRDLQGKAAIGDLATRVGRSRFAVSRWLHGQTEPRLPDFFRLLDATSLRLIDFVAVLVDATEMPSIRDVYLEMEQARRATYQRPWSQAVLRALETVSYQRLVRHEPGCLAQMLDIDVEEEASVLRLLADTEQIEMVDGKYQLVSESRVVDTRRDPKAAYALRAFWADVARARMDEPGDGLFSHNVFGVSASDYQRIRELQKAYYQEVRAIVAESEPVERVALLNVQLLPLSE